MSKLSWSLLVLLMVSISLNVIQYNQSSSSSAQLPQSEQITDSTSPTPDLQREQLTVQQVPRLSAPSTPETVPTAEIQMIRTLLAEGQFTQAQAIINEQLQRDPTNIDLLMLEARIVAENESAADLLAYYYELLDLPLTEAQATNIRKIINTTAQKNIAELKSLAAWDVLSDFLEPLWQFDPENINYIISLAEAYARQKLEAPMENVLASLSPDDRRIAQLRELLAMDESQAASATLLPQNLLAAPSVELTPYGNHYLVGTRLNRQNVSLMIDTGASTTAISASVLRRLQSSGERVRFIGRYQVNTAGGRIMARVFELNRLTIGEKIVENVAVLVLPDRNLEPAQGLLGMNVLSKFNFHIDQQEAKLYLSERP